MDILLATWVIGGLMLGMLFARPAMAAFGDANLGRHGAVVFVLILLLIFGPAYWVVMFIYPWVNRKDRL